MLTTDVEIIELKNHDLPNLHTPWDTWTFWISNVMMIVMIIITTIWTIHIFRTSKFVWVKFMYVICVLQNYVTLYLSFGDYFE